VAFGGGAGHAEHRAPHEVTLVLLTHAPPQTWNPALHAKPHDVPSHVAVAFAGAAHPVQDAPQVVTAVLLTHVPPQSWSPTLQT